MKLIIAGSRKISPSTELINALLNQYGIIEEVDIYVSGGAKGVDTACEDFAEEMKELCGPDNIHLKVFEANWTLHGKKAGPIRNRQMAEYADALLLIWDGESKGSANMKSEMLKLEKPVYEVILK